MQSLIKEEERKHMGEIMKLFVHLVWDFKFVVNEEEKNPQTIFFFNFRN